MIGVAEDLLTGKASVALVRITRVRGSAPREEGAWMLVSGEAVAGTIGGGQLEYMAIDQARACLSGGDAAVMDVPLGPEIGQCCGGRVELSVSVLDAAGRKAFLATLHREQDHRPHVYLFGAGHVGRALAVALDPLPVRCVVIDTRAEELALVPGHIETRLTAMPEAEVRAAPFGSAFVVLTHDHALDFLIVQEALTWGEAAYVGMIGSATKRAQFESWLRRQPGAPDAEALVCPIAQAGPQDKRPEVIAAFAATEIFAAVAQFSRVEAEA